MKKFYFYTWAYWGIRISLCSLLLASSITLLITLGTYLNLGVPHLSIEVNYALLDISIFWFPLICSITLLVALFRSLKYIFNIPRAGYMLTLLECTSKELVEVIGYGDLIKVWRKWFMLMIWLVGTQMIIASLILYLLGSYTSVLEWFNIYTLYFFIIVSGYFSFILLGGKCKKVKVIRC